MNRQFRRRIEREWNKISIGKTCTGFLERNGLYTIPYVVYFQAVKIGDDLMCVYGVSLFEHKENAGHLEAAHVCQFVDSLFRSLALIELGFVTDVELDDDEEFDDLA